jgi:hypothetical protein
LFGLIIYYLKSMKSYSLPHLNSLWMTGCDLSDHGLLETLLPNRNMYNLEYFPNLNLLDCRLATRVSYFSIKKLRDAKRLNELHHTSIPSFMELFRDHSTQRCCEIGEDGCLLTWTSSDAHMVRANAVIPSRLENIFYFEVKCLHNGVDGGIGIGLAPRGHSGSGNEGDVM